MTDMSFETAGNPGAGWQIRPAHVSHGARAMRGHDARMASHRREYWAYFAVVLILALPLSLAVWMLRALRTLSLPERGPLRAAWSQAAIITSIILSA